MSKGALNEILNATSEKFNIMAKSIPNSEKITVLKFLEKRYNLLGDVY